MSVEMEIHVENLPALREKLIQLDDIMKRKVQEAMKFEAEAMKTMARERCPVRTGRLRDSIYATVQDWTVQIGATAPYAIYQELGTRYIEPREFLKNAVELHMQSLISRLNRALGESIKEAST